MNEYDVTIKGANGYESTVTYEAENASHAILIAGVHWAFCQIEGAAGRLIEAYSPGFFDRVIPAMVGRLRDEHSVEVVEVQK